MTQTGLATVAIPVCGRLEHLPRAVASVRRQDYPDVELLVSDNGPSPPVRALVGQHYGKPFRFRQNAVTVPIATHFNQLVAAASGEYFTLLSDDDEISPNYLSTLVRRLDRNPRAVLGLARVEAMDASGRTTGSTDEMPLPPTTMTGAGFVRAWCLRAHRFICLATNLARTEDIRAVGGYPRFESGHGIDNALVVKLGLLGEVVFAAECTFRYRVHAASYGQAASCSDLARASREFLAFLEADPEVLRLAKTRPDLWPSTKALLVRMTYRQYLGRWARVHRRRMAVWPWIKAGFALPGGPLPYARALLPPARAPARAPGG